jgi:hypothetical protein
MGKMSAALRYQVDKISTEARKLAYTSSDWTEIGPLLSELEEAAKKGDTAKCQSKLEAIRQRV